MNQQAFSHYITHTGAKNGKKSTPHLVSANAPLLHLMDQRFHGGYTD